MARCLGADGEGADLEVCGEEERGEGAVAGLEVVPQREEARHLGHQDVARWEQSHRVSADVSSSVSPYCLGWGGG